LVFLSFPTALSAILAPFSSPAVIDFLFKIKAVLFPNEKSPLADRYFAGFFFLSCRKRICRTSVRADLAFAAVGSNVNNYLMLAGKKSELWYSHGLRTERYQV
jgi:hypothetical protein